MRWSSGLEWCRKSKLGYCNKQKSLVFVSNKEKETKIKARKFVQRIYLKQSRSTWLTVVWPNPAGVVEANKEGVELLNKLPPKPVEGLLRRLDPNAGVDC